jgi:hypothetical protein
MYALSTRRDLDYCGKIVAVELPLLKNKKDAGGGLHNPRLISTLP